MGILSRFSWHIPRGFAILGQFLTRGTSRVPSRDNSPLRVPTSPGPGVDFAVRALDDSHDRSAAKTEGDRDRYAYNREDILRQCLEAWRENPLARRIVELTSDYVVGGGLGLAADDPEAHAFLDQWWNHRLNHMPIRVFEWCDELVRAGELFPLVSTDASGMSYVRAIPALDILDIESAPNDVEQERSYKQRPDTIGQDPKTWKAYDEATDAPDESGGFAPVMLHYSINRPVGAQRGEPDLAPLLKWLTRYSAWLEDRVRLNRFRQVFLYWVHRAFSNEAERLKRQAELNSNPPNPGSILVTDEEEKWDVLQPRLDSFEAKEDGFAVKKMVAAGAGIPMHFLAEPESSTRTTAEQSGGPTFRHYGRRQDFFVWMITDLAQIAVRRRAMIDQKVKADATVEVAGTDISVRDNASLADAASKVVAAFKELRDRGLVTDEELLRVTYRFAGEIVDVGALLADAKKQGPPVGAGLAPAQSPAAAKPPNWKEKPA
jgi:hypothetical protein